jgi:SAM-dependent methyltransferase
MGIVKGSLVSVPPDYDVNPERYRLGMRVMATHTTVDLYTRIAGMLHRARARRILDVGCGEGVLTTAVRHVGVLDTRIVGVDASATMLRRHPGPKVRGTATALPFRDCAFDAVVAVNVLYYVTDPVAAIGEAYRVLRRAGLFIAATTSRHDSPELAHVWRPTPTTFDAEDAPALVGSIFPDTHAERWDAPLVMLPNADSVRDYLIARLVLASEAAKAATRVATPVTITKRGALVYARKPTEDG